MLVIMNSTQSFRGGGPFAIQLKLYRSELVMYEKAEGYWGKHTVDLGYALCDA